MDGAIEKLRLLLEEQKEIIANLRKENARLKAELNALSKRSKHKGSESKGYKQRSGNDETSERSARKARSPPPSKSLPSKPMPTRSLPNNPTVKVHSPRNDDLRDRMDSTMTDTSMVSSISSVSTATSSIVSESGFSRGTSQGGSRYGTISLLTLSTSTPQHIHIDSSHKQHQQNNMKPNTNSKTNSKSNVASNGKVDKGGVSSGMNQSDAKNNLAMLLGGRGKGAPLKKAATTAITATTTTSASTSGASMTSTANNDESDNSQGSSLQIAQPSKLKKYYKLKKMMPVHVIVNRMRFEGVPKLLICQFEEKPMAAPPPEGVNLTQISVGSPPKIPASVWSFVKSQKQNSGNKDDIKTEEEDDDPTSKLPKKKKIVTNKKLKRLHWRPISTDKVIGSLWEEADDEKVDFNINEFELHWQFRNPKPKELGGNGTEGGSRGGKSKNGEQQHILFVPPKRSQNVQIALSRFKMKSEDIKQSIIVMDEKVFPVEVLQQFLDVVPTEDEQRETEKMANKPDLDPKQFGKCEKFFYQMIDMVDLQLRLELWVFKQQYKELLTDRQVQLRTLDNACTVLHKSKYLKNIFEIILAFGNYMNAGTHAGQAYGFELESLRILSGVKTFDNSMTMMMYLYKHLYTKHPKLLDVFDELKPIKIVARMEIDLIDKSVKSIKEKVDLVKTTLDRWEEDYEDVLAVDDNFLPVMSTFHKEAKKQTAKLVMQHKRCQTKIHKVAAYYGHDLAEASIEQLFQMIQSFLDDLEKGRDDIHRLELERDKRRKRRERKKKKNKKKGGHGGHGNDNDENESKVNGNKLSVNEPSILDDIKKRRQTRTRVLSIIGDKLNSSLREKSQLIEAVNNNSQIPDTFAKSEIRRKVSVQYQANVENVKVVPQGRMRLPTIVRAKGLPALPQKKSSGFRIFSGRNKTKNQFYHQPQKYNYGGANYQDSSMAARQRTISNNKDDMNTVNGQRFHDSIETPLARLGRDDLAKSSSLRGSMKNLFVNASSPKVVPQAPAEEAPRMSSNPLASPKFQPQTQSMPVSPRDRNGTNKSHKSKKSKNKSKHKAESQTPQWEDSNYHKNMQQYQQTNYTPTPTFNNDILSPDTTYSNHSNHTSPYHTPKGKNKKGSFSDTKVEDMTDRQFSMIVARNRTSARDVTNTTTKNVEQSWD